MNNSILSVEDSPLNSRLIHALLSYAGFNVIDTSDAENALKALENVVPVLILADIRLPGISGLDLARLLKADGSKCNIPVVAVTADDSPAARTAIQDAGCIGFISKPIDTALFAAQVRAFIERSESVAPALPSEENGVQLRKNFLQEGTEESTLLIRYLDQRATDRQFMSEVLHRWIRTGSTAGTPEISTRARKMRDMLDTRNHVFDNGLAAEAQALKTLFDEALATSTGSHGA